MTVEDDGGGVTVLVLAGELDIAHARRLGSAVQDVLCTGPAAIVIDICGVDFVDSTGLAVLLNARRRTLRRGIRLALACDVPSTIKLLALTRLERDFDVYPNRAAAVAACTALLSAAG